MERMPQIQLSCRNIVLSVDTSFIASADFRDINQNIKNLSVSIFFFVVNNKNLKQITQFCL